MKVWKNFNEVLTLKSASEKDGRHLKASDSDLLSQAHIVFDDQKIHWVGEALPSEFQSLPSVDYSGHVLTPELVDCHTHIPFGGDRAFEYTLRLNGADYQKIAQAGGGILNTTEGTRALSQEGLFQISCERVERLYSYGVGTIEVKSGYGLSLEKEEELTLLIDQLKKKYTPKIQILNTFMAAHAKPAELSSTKDYLNQVVLPLMEKLKDKIDAVDIFHEVGYFSGEDVHTLFSRAQELNLAVKIHADEFQDNDGATLACQYQGLSCDHLMMTSDKGIQELVKSDTVATLLPGTSFFLGKPLAPAQKFLQAGCKVAIGSDYNPGSCHIDNLLLVASMAAPQYKMNMAQLWAAITLNAAHALGLKNQGALIPGLKPRFSIFKVPTLAHVSYHWGQNFAVTQ